MEENENMNNYFAGNAVCVKLMDKLGCCVQKVKREVPLSERCLS